MTITTVKIHNETINRTQKKHRNRMNKTQTTTMALCAVVCFSANAQNLLLNGSFESPGIPANTIAIATPDAWQGSASTRIISGNYGSPEFPGPEDGHQYVALGNDGILGSASQAFVITTPGIYALRWFDNAGNHPDTSPYSVVVIGPGGVVASVTNNASHFALGWLPQSMQLNLSPGTYTVRFRSELPSPYGLSALIDNVSLETNLLLNGGFESPSIAGNTRQTATPTSWTVGVDSVLISGNGGVPESPLPQEGQQYVSIATSPAYTLSQGFTITAGTRYVVRWFDGAAHMPGETQKAPYSMAVLTDTLQTIASASFEGLHPENWKERSLSMTLNPGNYILRFTGAGIGPGGLSPLFDNVSVQTDNSDLLLNIHASAVDICWAGFTNQMYQVQYRTNSSATNWFNFGSPVQGTGTNCVTDWINGTEQRYYRTIRLP